MVAIEPKTGGILAMASGPGYDPNIADGIQTSRPIIGRLFLDVSGPLLNRAIKGQYPPGSTYKPLGALIGLDEGVITPASGYPCHGVYLVLLPSNQMLEKPSRVTQPTCAWRSPIPAIHFFPILCGCTMDNPAFHSARVGLTQWKEYVNAFGLGHRIGRRSAQ